MNEDEQAQCDTHSDATAVSQGVAADGLRNAAEYVMTAAKAAFERHGGDDITANRLRSIGNELHCMANVAYAEADPHWIRFIERANGWARTPPGAMITVNIRGEEYEIRRKG